MRYELDSVTHPSPHIKRFDHCPSKHRHCCACMQCDCAISVHINVALSLLIGFLFSYQRSGQLKNRFTVYTEYMHGQVTVFVGGRDFLWFCMTQTVGRLRFILFLVAFLSRKNLCFYLFCRSPEPAVLPKARTGS